MKRLLLTVVVALFGCCVDSDVDAIEQTDRWETHNAGGGGALNSPVIDPESGTWAVGSDLSGAYLSHDQGRSWTAIGSAEGLPETHVSALAFASKGRLVIGTERGIYLTQPNGTNVVRAGELGYVSAVSASLDPNILYAVSHPAWDALNPLVWQSIDGGNTWTETASNLPQDLRITAIRVHPTDPHALIVVAAEGRWPDDVSIANRAYLSEDGGTTFSRIDPDRGEVYDIRYDLTIGNRVWLTVGEGPEGELFRSSDAGWTWQSVSLGRSGVIWLDRDRPSRVRLIEVTGHGADDPAGGVWESDDDGQSFTQSSTIDDWNQHWPEWTWSYAASFQGLLQTVGFSDTDPEVAVWVTTQWAFASVDGRSFVSAMGDQVNGGFRSAGLDNVVPHGVAPSLADPLVVYSYNWDIGCQRSNDGGESWRPCNQTWVDGVRVSAWENDNGGDVATLTTDPARTGVVWAAMTADKESPVARIVRSDSAGTSGSWRLSDSGIPPATYIGGLSVDQSSPADQRTLFVVVDGSVYRSSDDGWSWEWVEGCSLGEANGCQATWTAGNGVVFAGGGSGLYRSLSSGMPGTWSAIGAGELDGDPWIVAPWDDGFAGVSDVAVDPADPATVWVARFGSGLFRSSDGGETFEKVNDDSFVRTVVVDSSGTVWTGSSSSTFHGGWHPLSAGVMVSHDRGASWTAANTGLSWPLVLDLVIDSSGALWAAHAGLGTARFG